MSVGQASNPKEAMKWLKKSADSGYVRAQYQLALCLHQGRVVQANLVEAVCAFFYLILCYVVLDIYGCPRSVESDNAMCWTCAFSSFEEMF